MSIRIFVSHSHKDDAWTIPFITKLQQFDLDVWYDKNNLHAGTRWMSVLEREIVERDTFLILISPQSLASEWVQDELQLAMRMRKIIIGVRFQEVEVKGFLGNRQLIPVIGMQPQHAATIVHEELKLSIQPVSYEFCQIEIEIAGEFYSKYTDEVYMDIYFTAWHYDSDFLKKSSEVRFTLPDDYSACPTDESVEIILRDEGWEKLSQLGPTLENKRFRRLIQN